MIVYILVLSISFLALYKIAFEALSLFTRSESRCSGLTPGISVSGLALTFSFFPSVHQETRLKGHTILTPASLVSN